MASKAERSEQRRVQESRTSSFALHSSTKLGSRVKKVGFVEIKAVKLFDFSYLYQPCLL